MDWLFHPAYASARDRLCERLKPKSTFNFRAHPNFVFLCGAFNGTRRNHIQSLVTCHTQGEVPFQVFRAEDIWQELRERKDDALDLLVMERYIGQISDIIIIIVESPGTFAELGAFVTDKNLKDKLLLILDNSYESAESFINDGPISYFNHGTNGPFRPALYTDFSSITSCKTELDLRLSQTPRQARRHIKNIANYSKLQFLYVLDLVALLGPVSLRQVHYFTRHIELELPMPMVETLLLLGASLGFIKYLKTHGETYYYSEVFVSDAKTYHKMKDIDFVVERARILGILQRIPEARQVLRLLGDA